MFEFISNVLYSSLAISGWYALELPKGKAILPANLLESWSLDFILLGVKDIVEGLYMFDYWRS